MDTKKIVLRAIVFAMLLSSLGCGETQSRHWSTAKEIERGTVGEWLIVDPPPKARDITLIYKIDSNEIWEFFKVDGFDIKSLPDGCEEARDTEVSLPRQPKRHVLFSIPGWPERLTDKNKSRIEGVRLFRCSQKPPYPAWKGPNYYYLSIDKDSSSVFAWNNDGG